MESRTIIRLDSCGYAHCSGVEPNIDLHLSGLALWNWRHWFDKTRPRFHAPSCHISPGHPSLPGGYQIDDICFAVARAESVSSTRRVDVDYR